MIQYIKKPYCRMMVLSYNKNDGNFQMKMLLFLAYCELFKVAFFDILNISYLRYYRYTNPGLDLRIMDSQYGQRMTTSSYWIYYNSF